MTVLVVVTAATTASAATYNYVSWSAADVSGGTASGTIDLGGGNSVAVTFTASTGDGGTGNLYAAQVGGAGTNYWVPTSTFESSQVENAPPTPDILELSGGQNETYTVSLSQPIVDPIMAIVSLGSSQASISYDFNSPFTIVSQGADTWGGSAAGLVQLPGNVLSGMEGSGVIRFLGTYAQFSWTVPMPETWHGFTFGVLTSAALYDGGGPDGSGVVVGADGGRDATADARGGDASAAADAAIGPGDAATGRDGGGDGKLAAASRTDSGCSCAAAGAAGGRQPARVLLGAAGL
ncbi:MAG TPA: hypothetical protein VHO06_22040, partial [Polyangia bacterium]|nr:hypothetical protein [Polyangia bacterium]